MKKVVLALSLFVSFFTVEAQEAEQQAVRDAFDQYKQAILSGKGEEAVKYVDRKTIDYYGEMVTLSRTADREKIESLSILDMLMVIILRQRAGEKLLKMDGKSALIYAVDEGMIGRNSVARRSIGDVTIEGDVARGQYVVGEEVSPFELEFSKEGDEWKVNITSLFDISNKPIEEMQQASGLSRSEFVIKMVLGVDPDDTIWEPLE